MILEFLSGLLNALCATCSLFFLAVLCLWNVIPFWKLLDLASAPTPWEEFISFVKKPSIFPQPSTPQCSITPSHSLSESCCWLNNFLQDIYFRMADGELIRTIKETVIEPQINAKLAAIQSEYNKFTGKITLTDLSIRSLPTLTAVHSMTNSSVGKEVAVAFDFEYNGGITFQIVAKPSVVGPVKFDARMDYFKSRLVIQYVKNASGFPSWSVSLSEAPKISIVLGVGKHNFSGIARIIQKILHDSLQNIIVYPNMYKFVVQPQHIGFGNCFIPVKESLGAHYVVKVVRGRNLPVKHDLKGPTVGLSYGASGSGSASASSDGEKHFRTPTAKCLPSPVWKSTWHFVPMEKHSSLKVTLSQKNKLSKTVVSLAAFEIPLAMFPKGTFKRIRYRLDGLLLTAEASRAATYLSFDISYWEPYASASELESMAAYLYGSEGAEERARVALMRKKPSKFMTILKATAATSSSSKKPTSYSSSDLIRYLDGQSSMVFTAGSTADLQFIMTSLREKSAALSRFWNQQMEILRGSKNGESSIAAFSDISSVIGEMSKQVALFLEAFKKIPESFKELNDICDHHDILSSQITHLFRLLGGKSTKHFKFLPQIYEYLKEISQLVGLINQSLYQGNAEDNASALAATQPHNLHASDDNLYESNASIQMEESVPEAEFLAADSGYSSNDLVEEPSVPLISISGEDSVPLRLSPSPSVASSIASVGLSSAPADQASFCRLFKTRSQFVVGPKAIEFKPSFEKLLLSSQEGMFYLVDADSVTKIYNERAFSTFKSDRRVLGTVSGHRITFSKPDAPSQSTIIIISCMEVAKITIKNISNSHLNLLKIESCQTGVLPVYISGEKGMLLHFFAAIASWMVYYDACSSGGGATNSHPIGQYQIPYHLISSVKMTRANLFLYFKGKPLVGGISESIGNNALMLRDFFGTAQKQACYSSLISHLPASCIVPDDGVDEERQDFVFSKSAKSTLPSDYYFVHFKVTDRGDPRAIEECSIDNGPSGEVSVGKDGIYWWSASSTISKTGAAGNQCYIPFSHVQTLKMTGGSLLGGFGGVGSPKGIKIGLLNGNTLTLTGFKKKGARQAFFNDAFLALSK